MCGMRRRHRSGGSKDEPKEIAREPGRPHLVNAEAFDKRTITACRARGYGAQPGYRETLRVLKPGGHFLFNAWDRIAENEFAGVVTQVLAALFPQDPPDFMARTPHGYFDVERIRDELVGALDFSRDKG
jgi:SAM-dependent methyltransferase